jgi:uncharacterized protein involved in outer membrane biogenesis
MKIFWTILAIAGGLVLLLLIGVAIAVWTVDVNQFVAPIQKKVKEATGRDLTIGGGIHLSLGLEPKLVLDDVHFGNAPWAKDKDLATVKHVEADVALLPLLQRRFEIVRVTLVDPVISLETDAQGRGNWLFGAATDGAPPASGPEAAVAAVPALGVGEIEVRNGQLTYRDGVTGAVTPVVVEALDVHARNPAAPISGEFRGVVNGVPVALKGNLGPPAQLQAQQWPYPIDVSGTVAGRTAKVEAKVTPQGGGMRVDDLSLAFGELAVQGTVMVDRSGPRPKYVVDLHLPRWVPDALVLPAVASASRLPATPPAASRHLIADQPIALGALRTLDAQGTVAIDTVALPHGQALAQVRLRFALQDGRLDIAELTGAGLGGTVMARGGVRVSDHDAKGAALDLHAEGRDLALASLLALAGAPREVSGGRTRITFDGKASGASLHEWASTLDGQAVLLVGPAQLKSPPGSSTAVLDQLGAAINPFRATKGVTDLRCAVMRLPLHDGVAQIDRSIAMETAELGVSASGTIDLANETLDLSIKPQVRSGIAIDVAGFADLVRVRGPLDRPQIGIDPVKSAQTVARIGAAIGTGGWSLLGETLFNTAAAADSPCAIALGGHGAPPAATPGASPGNIPADLGRALGKLFGR